MADEQAVRLTADDRRRKVAEMTAGGFSQREIARRLEAEGYPNANKSTIARDCKANEKLWHDAIVGDIQVVKDRHARQLDETIERLRRAAFAITNAVEAAEFHTAHIFPLLKERAKLLGLYAPTRVDVYDYVRRWSREHGFDEVRAVELAQEVIDQEGF